MSFTEIQFRRDLEANWSSLNPILDSGEPGFAIDTQRLKVGNGSLAWNSLGLEPANYVYAGPVSGADDFPIFRPLSSLDIPSLSGAYVPITRLINTTAPLTGGGALSSDLTLAITQGDLTAASAKILVTGGIGAVLGSGASVDVQEAFLNLNNQSGTLIVSKGGTGLTTVAQGDLLFVSVSGPPGTPVISRLAKSATATRYLSNTGTSNNPAWAQVNLANGVTGQLPTGNLTDNSVTYAKIQQASAQTLLGNWTAGIANVAEITLAAPFSFQSGQLTLNINGALQVLGGSLSIRLAQADGATTGIAAFTAADFNDNGSGLISIDYANGQQATTSQPGFLTAADWNTFNGKQAALTGVQGDIIYFSATNTISNLAKSTTATRYLSNTGTTNNPAWAQIDLTNGVTGTLPVGSGGTGTGTAFTAGSVVFAGASGVYSQNNSKFFWDNTAVALCLGTVTQAGLLTTLGATGAANTAGQVGASITGGVGGTSNTSSAAGAGGAITITTGAGGVASSSGAGGAGGLLTLKAGNGAAGGLGNSGIGGGVTIQSGNGATSSSGALAPSNGGVVAISSGAGSNGSGAAGSSSGGAINITSGVGGAQSSTNGNAGQGGAITISCGISGANSTGFSTGANGAAITITPGGGGGSPSAVPGGTGGALNLNSGAGGNSNAAAGGNGGNIVILANAAGTSGAGGGNGGTVSVNPGAGSGSGSTGTVLLCNVRGNCAVGNVTPTAQLHIAAGTASLAPLKLTSGTNLTSAAAGAFEFDGTNLYFTPASTRRTVPLIPGTDYQTPITTSVTNSGTTPTTLTTSAAAVTGTITLATAGTYLLQASFDFTLLDTFSADTNFTFTFRRTNNTAANVGNALPITVSNYSYAAGGGATETWGIITLPAVSYVATAGDIITVNGNGITTLNSGTWKVGNSWSLSAIRIA